MKLLSSLAVLFLTSSANALTSFVKSNVRNNLGDNRVIMVDSSSVQEMIDLLNGESGFDRFGATSSHQYLKVAVEDLRVVEESGVLFDDITEEFISRMEGNLNSEGFVCEEDPQVCAAKSADDFYASYQTLESLYARYNNLALSSDEASWERLGISYEGREQRVLWIGDDGEKPLVFYYCALHAREWITPLFCTHLAETLLDPSNPEGRDLISKFAFAITPVANPDGYVYSHTTNNMWRKTRMPNQKALDTGREICNGTDPNRNFAFGWGGVGASTDPCQETYRGSSALNQPEVRNLVSFTDRYKDRLIHINDVHSYGQYYLSAYGFTEDLPPQQDYIKMERTNQALYDAILDHNGVRFKVGPTATTIYPASGGSMDHYYGIDGVIYAGAYEARGSRSIFGNGFQPETSQIAPSNAELFVGTYAFLQKVWELEFCEDVSFTNIYLDSKSGRAEKCDQLEDFCDNQQVMLRCASTCNACVAKEAFTSRNILDVSSPVVLNQPNQREENNQSSGKKTSSAGVLAGVLLALVAFLVFGGIYTSMKKASKSEAEEENVEDQPKEDVALESEIENPSAMKHYV